MTDPNNQQQEHPSQDTLIDIDPEDMVIIDGDDEDALIFQNDVPLAPPMPLVPAGGGGLAHRVRSAQIGGFQFPQQFLFRGVEALSTRFDWNLRVMAARHLENRGHTDLESGGKVILPQRALEELSRDSSVLLRPMMFHVTNPASNPQKSTHCGVLEFIAEEGIVYMPFWMMAILGVDDHDILHFDRVELPTASFAKFQPQTVDFLEISNPKAMLENSFRRFACLTRGDVLAIHYNNRVYELCVVETRPSRAVSIIECDMDVDFDAPVGYHSPNAAASELEDEDETEEEAEKVPTFIGAGYRLNGKVSNTTNSITTGAQGIKSAGSRRKPDETWKIGTLTFKRTFNKKHGSKAKEEQGSKKIVDPFAGIGFSLKTRKNS